MALNLCIKQWYLADELAWKVLESLEGVGAKRPCSCQSHIAIVSDTYAYAHVETKENTTCSAHASSANAA